MDAEEFFRREAAELLARYPGMKPEEIAREMQKDDHRGDPAVAATVLEVAARIRAQAGGLESCTTRAVPPQSWEASSLRRVCPAMNEVL